MKIEVNNGCMMYINESTRGGIIVELFDEKDEEEIIPEMFISEGDVVALVNLARLIYKRGYSVDGYCAQFDVPLMIK